MHGEMIKKKIQCTIYVVTFYKLHVCFSLFDVV